MAAQDNMQPHYTLVMGDDIERTADDVADLLLDASELSEWAKGLVAVVLTQLVAQGHTVLRADDVFPAVMRSASGRTPEQAADLVYALTAIGFTLKHRPTPQGLRFRVVARATFPPGPRERFDALHAQLGWGTPAHIRALDVFVADAFDAYWP